MKAKKDNANPVITMRPDPDLIEKAKAAGLNTRELLENAIRKKLNLKICPACGQKIKGAR